jgi:DNA-binding NtrC family response regulator
VKVLDTLYQRDWPGNIRQLQNALQRYVTLKRLSFGEEEDEPGPMTSDDIFQKVITHEELGLWDIMEDLEKRVIAEILERTHGNLSKAARTLRIPRRTLRRRIEKYHLQWIGHNAHLWALCPVHSFPPFIWKFPDILHS